jgi:hypothetical protein
MRRRRQSNEIRGTHRVNVPAYKTVTVDAASEEEAERLVEANLKHYAWEDEDNDACFEAEWKLADELHVCEGATTEAKEVGSTVEEVTE